MNPPGAWGFARVSFCGRFLGAFFPGFFGVPVSLGLVSPPFVIRREGFGAHRADSGSLPSPSQLTAQHWPDQEVEGCPCPQPQHNLVSNSGSFRLLLAGLPGFSVFVPWFPLFALFWLFGRFSWLSFPGGLGFADKIGADMSS